MSDQRDVNLPADDDQVVAVCLDCGNTIPDSRAEKDVFLQAGKPGLCPYCGGPVGVTYQSEVDKIRRQRLANDY